MNNSYLIGYYEGYMNKQAQPASFKEVDGYWSTMGSGHLQKRMEAEKDAIAARFNKSKAEWAKRQENSNLHSMED
jgi:hypothetical protein